MNAMRGSAPRSAVLLGSRLVGAGLVFFLQAAIARLWGATVLGDYLLIIAVVNLAGCAMPLGFNTIGTYFTASYAARGGGRPLRSLLLQAWRNVAVVALLLLAARPLIGFIFGEGTALLHQAWISGMVLAAAMAFVFVNGAVLVGLGFPLAGFIADLVFRPLAMLAAFIVVLAFGSGEEHAVMLVRVAAPIYACVALTHAWATVAAIRHVPASIEFPARESRRWWRFAASWVVIAIATEFFFDIDLLVLAPLLTREELAIFGVCARIFALIAFGMTAVYAVLTPTIVTAEAQSDLGGLSRKVVDANLLAAAFVAAACVGVFVFGPHLLRLFGESFVAGATPLTLMCIGLAARAIMGPASLILSIYDRPHASLPAIGLGLATLLVANLVLVPIYGLNGAGVAAAVAMAVWATMLWMTALRYTQLDVSILPLLKRTLRP